MPLVVSAPSATAAAVNRPRAPRLGTGLRPHAPVGPTPRNGTSLSNRRAGTIIRFQPDDRADTREMRRQVAPGTVVPVMFELVKKCGFGDAWGVVGSTAELGAWDPKRAIPLKWTPGDRWVSVVALPAAQDLEYKYVLMDNTNKGRITFKAWDNQVAGGNNLKVHVQIGEEVRANGATARVLDLVPNKTGTSTTTTTSSSSLSGSAIAAPAPIPTFIDEWIKPNTTAHGPTTPTSTSTSARSSAHITAREFTVTSDAALPSITPPMAEPSRAAPHAGPAPPSGVASTHWQTTTIPPHAPTTPSVLPGASSAHHHVGHVVQPGEGVEHPGFDDLGNPVAGPYEHSTTGRHHQPSSLDRLGGAISKVVTPVGQGIRNAASAITGGGGPPAYDHDRADPANQMTMLGTPASGPARQHIVTDSLTTDATLAGVAPGTVLDPSHLPHLDQSSLDYRPVHTDFSAGDAAGGAGSTLNNITPLTAGEYTSTGTAGEVMVGNAGPYAAGYPPGSYTPAVTGEDARHTIAADAGLDLPVSDTMATGSSILSNITGGDEEMPESPLHSGLTPTTGSHAASGGNALNPHSNPVAMMVSVISGTGRSLMNKVWGGGDRATPAAPPAALSDMRSSAQDPVVPATIPQDGRTAGDMMTSNNAFPGFAYPSEMLAAFSARQAEAGEGAGEGEGAQPGSGQQDKGQGDMMSPKDDPSRAPESGTEREGGSNVRAPNPTSTPATNENEQGVENAPESGTIGRV